MSAGQEGMNKHPNQVSRALRALIGCGFAGIAFFFAFSPAYASNFSVSPTSLELGGAAKSGAFSVINSDTEKLNCQIYVKEWSQDASGRDTYTETKDIVFYPKIMTVGPNEQRAIRIGLKGPAGSKEKTYRLFVEEIPSQQKTQIEKKTDKMTAGLTVAFRYAVPIFVKPLKQQENASIEGMQMADGKVRSFVKNAGNVHLKLLNVTFRGRAVDGSELFSREASGWYVLNGMARPYEVEVPKELCSKLSLIEMNVQTENSTVNGKLNVQKNMCTQ